VADRENQLRDAFLGAISHELRTPLMTMLLWEKVLRDDTADSELRTRALDAIHESATVQSRLISDLIDFSRSMNGQLFVDSHPVEIGEVVTSAITSATPAATAKQLALTCDQTGQIEVQGDRQRLNQVLDTLLANAIKHTAPRGCISVSVRYDAPFAMIEICDTGRGYSKEALAQMFEPFHDSSIGHRAISPGLELAIARRLSILHRGSLTATSDGEGRGSTFRLALPGVMIRGRHSSPPRVWPPAAAPLEGLRVLVIDDDSRVRDALVRLIGRAGAIVESADSADSGRMAVARETPDALICDIAMPDEDGYSFVRWIRQLAGNAHEVPAIALTAFATATDSQQAYDAGFDLHLAKPIEITRLITNIHELVMIRRSGART
jgi:CheY-like chemotaxis protein